jgi:thiamine-phosphate pyrophosphorylase
LTQKANVIRYYITNRERYSNLDGLVNNVRIQLAEGIEMIQLRERDLSARELLNLLKQVLALPNPHATKILVNDRTDVAIAAGAHGVHLRSHAVEPCRLLSIAPQGFLVGVSCHTPDEVRQAASEGASFAVLAPIFPTPGKGPPIGLAPLAEAARAVSIPVLALGGINESRIRSCLDAGAVGIAAISLFQP